MLPQATAGTGIHAYLTGPNAGNVTFSNLIGQRLPWLIATVVALSMLLLLCVFRSVVIAVKAAVMNLLSITAAYGVLTAVTQWGWGGTAVRIPREDAGDDLGAGVPVRDPVRAVHGLRGVPAVPDPRGVRRRRTTTRRPWRAGWPRTARVITAAAAIMVVVFLSFDLTPTSSVKQVGLGLAVAVLIDATVVRLVLVPAVMELLGRANWWLPSLRTRTPPARISLVSTPGRTDKSGL